MTEPNLPNLGFPRLTTWGECEPFVTEGGTRPELSPSQMVLATPVVVSRQRMLVHAQGLYQRDPDLSVDLLVPLDTFVDWKPIITAYPADVESLLAD